MPNFRKAFFKDRLFPTGNHAGNHMVGDFLAWFLNKSEEEMLTIPTGSYWNDYTSAIVADSRRRYELAMTR